MEAGPRGNGYNIVNTSLKLQEKKKKENCLNIKHLFKY